MLGRPFLLTAGDHERFPDYKNLRKNCPLFRANRNLTFRGQRPPRRSVRQPWETMANHQYSHYRFRLPARVAMSQPSAAKPLAAAQPPKHLRKKIKPQYRSHPKVRTHAARSIPRRCKRIGYPRN
jgi:hypothetical protein